MPKCPLFLLSAESEILQLSKWSRAMAWACLARSLAADCRACLLPTAKCGRQENASTKIYSLPNPQNLWIILFYAAKHVMKDLGRGRLPWIIPVDSECNHMSSGERCRGRLDRCTQRRWHEDGGRDGSNGATRQGTPGRHYKLKGARNGFLRWKHGPITVGLLASELRKNKFVALTASCDNWLEQP